MRRPGVGFLLLLALAMAGGAIGAREPIDYFPESSRGVRKLDPSPCHPERSEGGGRWRAAPASGSLRSVRVAQAEGQPVALAAAGPSSAAGREVFVDRAAESGLVFTHDNGMTGALYMP